MHGSKQVFASVHLYVTKHDVGNEKKLIKIRRERPSQP